MTAYEGKRVVITGGTSGIGLATAELLSDGGARMLVTGRSPSSLTSARARLGEAALVVDSDAVSGVDALVERVRSEFGGVDLLVLNAGGTDTALVADTDEAIRIANDSDYGLAGSVFTGDDERGFEVATRIRTGTFGVNQGYPMDPFAPFGGVKASGYGRELGPEGIDGYTETKSVAIAAR